MIVRSGVCPSTNIPSIRFPDIPDSVSVELKDRNPEEAYVRRLCTYISTRSKVGHGKTCRLQSHAFAATALSKYSCISTMMKSAILSLLVASASAFAPASQVRIVVPKKDAGT